jgi:hypothetical protein
MGFLGRKCLGNINKCGKKLLGIFWNFFGFFPIFFLFFGPKMAILGQKWPKMPQKHQKQAKNDQKIFSKIFTFLGPIGSKMVFLGV